MPFQIKYINSSCEFSKKKKESPNQVFKLADDLILNLKIQIQEPVDFLISTTSCPDSLAPSLSQNLCEANHELLGNAHCFDLVQGCTGGVSALILASKLVEKINSRALVIQADAAQKATSKDRSYYRNFGNGAFASLFVNSKVGIELLYSKSYQVKGLEKVVQISLGHDADTIIQKEKEIKKDPRYFLGLKLNNKMAMVLLKKAKAFYSAFVKESCEPDVLILHQANPKIISFLEKFLSDFKGEFINMANVTGNCGTATTGIILHRSFETFKNKKVMICSYGTGGVITAGLWQF